MVRKGSVSRPVENVWRLCLGEETLAGYRSGSIKALFDSASLILSMVSFEPCLARSFRHQADQTDDQRFEDESRVYRIEFG